MNLLLIFGLFPKEIEEQIFKNSKKNIQYAANNLQWKILNGLYENLGSKSLFVLNSPFVGSYPFRYNKIFLEKSTIFSEKFQVVLGKSLPSFNLTFIKQFYVTFSMIYETLKWFKSLKRNNKKVIILYSLTITNILTSIFIRLLFRKRLKIVIIVPDLPEFMTFSKKVNPVIRLLKIFSIRFIYSFLFIFDGFVVLTDLMAKRIIRNKPFVVIEGIADENSINHTMSNNFSVESYKPYIAYTGGLESDYGVENLIDSFLKLNSSEFNLVICGDGSLSDKIKKISIINSKIIFLNQITSENAQKVQKNAHLLVNPRNSTLDYTKYSFPSKNLEYMVSGVPFLGYKLPGIPEEYLKHFYCIKIKSGLFDEDLKKVLSLPKKKLKMKGKSAYNFVKRYKNPKFQTRKLIKLINKL